MWRKVYVRGQSRGGCHHGKLKVKVDAVGKQDSIAQDLTAKSAVKHCTEAIAILQHWQSQNGEQVSKFHKSFVEVSVCWKLITWFVP